MYGVQTTHMTNPNVSDWAANDSPYVATFVNGTAVQFRIAEVAGGTAYMSHRSLESVVMAAGTPLSSLELTRLSRLRMLSSSAGITLTPVLNHSCTKSS
jgi:hypothetical protein